MWSSTIPIAVVDKIISLLHSQKDEVQLAKEYEDATAKGSF